MISLGKLFKNQILCKLSTTEAVDFGKLEKEGSSFKDLCQKKLQSLKKMTKSKNKFNRRAEKKKKELEKKNEKNKQKLSKRQQQRVEKKELKKMMLLYPERFVTAPVDTYCTGSGMGIYQRTANLKVEKIVDSKNVLKIQELKENPLKTPFGFDSFQAEIGNLKHLFKGPITDPNGHNCWLNAILVFILSNPCLVNQILSNQNEKQNDLKNLFIHWITKQNDENFREEFQFLYGKVWLQIQKLGFKYGNDQQIKQPIETIFQFLNLELENENYVIGNISGEKNEKFELKSWVNCEILAYTKENLPIGHATCYAKNENGIFYYDDILKLNEDFQGGLMKKEFDFKNSNIQMALYSKKSFNSKFEEYPINLEIKINKSKIP